MRKTSLAKAKAHLSALVDEAEHKNRRILILRHGKPSAALVPAGEALAAERGPTPARGLSNKAIDALFAAFSAGAVGASAVEDLLEGRR